MYKSGFLFLDLNRVQPGLSLIGTPPYGADINENYGYALYRYYRYDDRIG